METGGQNFILKKKNFYNFKIVLTTSPKKYVFIITADDVLRSVIFSRTTVADWKHVVS